MDRLTEHPCRAFEVSSRRSHRPRLLGVLLQCRVPDLDCSMPGRDVPLTFRLSAADAIIARSLLLPFLFTPLHPSFHPHGDAVLATSRCITLFLHGNVTLMMMMIHVRLLHDPPATIRAFHQTMKGHTSSTLAAPERRTRTAPFLRLLLSARRPHWRRRRELGA